MKFSVAAMLTLLLVAGPSAANVQNLLSTPDDKIDIGLAALTCAKERYPEIRVAAYSAKIDALAKQVRRLAKGSTDPDTRVRCLNTVLFLQEKFRANRDTTFQRKPEMYFLNELLDTKIGNCFSMPLLYVAVGQRLGWPIYLVHVPDHSFVRYVDPVFSEQNIETTSGGGYVPDATYAHDFLVSEAGRRSGAYLRSCTYREILGDLVAVNGIAFGRDGELPKAMAYLKMATRFNPRLVDAWANLANASRMMSKRTSGAEAEKYRIWAKTFEQRRDDLGFVHPHDVPLFTSAGKPAE